MSVDADETAMPGVLSKEMLRRRIASPTPLITDWEDLDFQLQPNGFDIRVAEISRHLGIGVVGRSNADRAVPGIEPLAADGDGFLTLAPGCYHIIYHEVVHLPADLMAFGRPRSSLNRCGSTIHTAVWDAGYEGRSTSLLAVLNPAGFRIQLGSRVTQLVFVSLASPTSDLYRGAYHGENIDRP
ncbi:MAG: deoxyuridine 5'-triphosphate nucleotidohydrolase [Thermomicrobiales bacterium]